MSDHKPYQLGGRLVTRPVMMLAPFILLCAMFIIKRLIFGIGSVADLNGGYAWGLWISFDLLIGTGLACGGWALAWAVYVFNRGEYHPLVRPALMASLFGYSLGGLSITIDVGRYWNLPYFYIPGHFNTSSVLFETAVCMTIYIGIMALEFAPVVLERFGWKNAQKFLDRFMVIILAFGTLLPTMHQSSMGSLMISAGYKIHPLWQSYELLPLQSLLTAFTMGFSIVMFEGSLVRAGLAGRTADETPLISRLSRIAEGLIWIFLVLRFGEIIMHDKSALLFTGDKYSVMFWVETAFLVLPLVILHWPRGRQDARALFLAGLSTMIGCALWRMNYSLFAMNPGNGYHYFPTAEELLISMGFVAIEICGYILLVRLLPILVKVGQPHSRPLVQARGKV
jgi:Ni/Fe-hydrogenase subunit HybB-like protein